LMQKILNCVKSYVKNDEPVVATVTYVYLSRWTREPLNLFLKGESTIGKSYVTKNVIKILGEDKDVWFLGGLSPTAFVHDYGVLKDESGYEINTMDAPSRRQIKIENPDAKPEEVSRLYREELKSWIEKLRNSYYEVDLEGKLLVFLEPPHIETFNKLRPILSHDTWRISYRFTDKTKTGQLRTSHVVIQGWPATIFCTSDEKYLHDLSTRSLTATPSLASEKIKAAATLSSDMSAYGEDLLGPEENEISEIQTLMDKVKVKAPKTVLTPLCHELQGKIKYWGNRVMRDWPHFLTMVKMNALLNFQERSKVYVGDKPRLIANMEDYLTVLTFWQKIEETTITGVSGSTLNVFSRLIKPLGPVTNYAQLAEKSRELYSEPLSSANLRKHVAALCSVGLVDTEPDPEDKRRKIIRVLGESRRLFEIMWDSVVSQFQAVFTAEKLKAWQKQLKQLCDEKGFSLQMFLPETNKPVEDYEVFYQKFLYLKPPLFHIIQKTQNKGEMEKEAENKGEIVEPRNFTQFKSLVRVTGSLYPTEKCAFCGKQPVEWQVTYHDDSWGLLCEECGRKLEKQLQEGGKE